MLIITFTRNLNVHLDMLQQLLAVFGFALASNGKVTGFTYQTLDSLNSATVIFREHLYRDAGDATLMNPMKTIVEKSFKLQQAKLMFQSFVTSWITYFLM